MKIYSIICTRDKNLTPLTSNLVHTLSSYGVEVKLLVNQKSIFEAYKKGLKSCNANNNDIIICCHDDLVLTSPKEQFIASIAKCTDKEVGFIGPAGTTHLGEDAVWWNHDRWQAGYHRGFVRHYNMKDKEAHGTHYGPHGPVVVLDGLFLAATKEVWEKVGLDKPTYYEGGWDFYDIHYTSRAHLLGLKNHTIAMEIVHYSVGDLAGRDSWHKNREAFIANTKLPLTLND